MKAFLLSLFLSLGFLGLTARAVHRRLLREQPSVLWLGVGVSMVFFSATLPFHLLNWLARQVGIAYPPDLLLVLGVLFLVVLVFQLSVSLARLNDKHTALVQEFGILTAREPDKREQSPPDPAGGAVESP